MPFSGFPPVYTPPAAAENAFSGKTIASADWNAIFTDLQSAISSLAQSLQSTGGRFMAQVVLSLSVSNTDYTFTVPIPTSAGFTRYQIDSIRISGPTTVPTGTPTVALFTAAAAGGTQYISSVAIGITSTVSNVTGNTAVFNLTIANQSTLSLSFPTLFFRVMAGSTNASGATVTLFVSPSS